MSDEVMTALPSHDALIQSQIQAMRTQSDQMAMMSKSMERMAVDLQTTRDGVIELKAQDLKATILAVRTEALGAVDKLRTDHEADIKDVAKSAEINSRAISRLQGIFLPLSIAATALLAFFGEWAANAFSGPHQP